VYETILISSLLRNHLCSGFHGVGRKRLDRRPLNAVSAIKIRQPVFANMFAYWCGLFVLLTWWWYIRCLPKKLRCRCLLQAARATTSGRFCRQIAPRE
jgi:hypothetical protein